MRHVFISGLLLLTVACGGARSKTVTPPLTPEQVAVFDHGIDFVSSLEGIEGRWRDDWDRDLQLRVGSADLIAVVSVRTVRTDTDPTQHVTYRLLASVERELVGKASDKELSLVVHDQQRGFPSVRENAERIADKRYLAYVKRGADGLESWHLSPSSDPVISETESKITQLARAPKQATGDRVIVHSH